MAKKKVLVGLLAVALTTGVAGTGFAKPNFARLPGCIQKNSVLINAGFGLGWFYEDIHDIIPSVMPGLDLSADYALPINFGLTLGLQSGFSGAGVNDDLSAGIIPVLFRVGYHPDLGVKNLDVYAHAKLGFAVGFWTGDNKSGYTNPAGFALGGSMGARYFFTNVIGAFAELGWEHYYLGYDYKVRNYSHSYGAYADKFLSLGLTFKIGGSSAK